MKQATIEKICLVSVLLLFSLIPLLRDYPIRGNMPYVLAGHDDWNFYAQHALEIKKGGCLIPSFHEEYSYPGGFFYNYFVAGCFALFGENTIPVYMLQSVLLGASVVLIFLAFRDKMKPRLRLFFLFWLTFFALMDVSKDYSVRLLSENLAIFTIAAFVYCLIRSLENKKLLWQAATVLFLVISVLTRPTIMPFGIVFAVLIVIYFFRYERQQLWKAGLFAAFVLAGISLIAIRNYIVCSKWVFLPTLGVYGSGMQVEQFSLSLFLKKLAFMFGYLKALAPDYQIRIHWLLALWPGYLAYLLFGREQFRKFELFEIPIHLFILVYCSLSLVFVTVESYGFRSFIPITLVLLPFTFMNKHMNVSGGPVQPDPKVKPVLPKEAE